MQSILMYSPPGFSPFVPTSAGATLVAYLKNNNVRAEEVDLNSGFVKQLSGNTFNSFFNPTNIIDFHNVALLFFDEVDLSKIYSKSTLELTLNDLLTLPESRLSNYLKNSLDYNQIENFEVIGISITVTRQLYSALIIAKLIKEKYPNKKIVLGGSALSSLFEQITHFTKIFDYFDYVVKGDGSIPLIEISKSYPPEKIHSIAYRKDDIVYFNNLSKLPQDLYAYLPEYNNVYLRNYPKPLLLGIPTHVGCYYGKCAFCDYGTVSAYKYNFCGTDALTDIIEKAILKYGVNGFYFTGAGMLPKDFGNLGQAIINKGLDVKWSAESLTVKYTEKQVQQIKNSGCINLDFGLESASEKIRAFLNKGFKIEAFNETLELFRQNDFRNSTMNLILLHPIGNKKDLDDTLQFLENNQDIIFHTHQSPKLDLRGYNDYYHILHKHTNQVVSGRADTLIRDFPYNTDNELLDYWLTEFKKLKISGHTDWKRCADVSLIDHSLYISQKSKKDWENMRKTLKAMDNLTTNDKNQSYSAW